MWAPMSLGQDIHSWFSIRTHTHELTGSEPFRFLKQEKYWEKKISPNHKYINAKGLEDRGVSMFK